jgi:hypothetical protein
MIITINPRKRVKLTFNDLNAGDAFRYTNERDYSDMYVRLAERRAFVSLKTGQVVDVDQNNNSEVTRFTCKGFDEDEPETINASPANPPKKAVEKVEDRAKLVVKEVQKLVQKWEDSIKEPFVGWAAMDGNGGVYVYPDEPNFDTQRKAWDSTEGCTGKVGEIRAKNLHPYAERSLVHTGTSDDLKPFRAEVLRLFRIAHNSSAIKPQFKWAAIDPNGDFYVYENKPEINSSETAWRDPESSMLRMSRLTMDTSKHDVHRYWKHSCVHIEDKE